MRKYPVLNETILVKDGNKWVPRVFLKHKNNFSEVIVYLPPSLVTQEYTEWAFMDEKIKVVDPNNLDEYIIVSVDHINSDGSFIDVFGDTISETIWEPL